MKYDFLRGTTPQQITDWAARLINDLNRARDLGEGVLGPFANDNAAAAAGVKVGASYVDTAGIYRRRLT